MIYHSDHHSKPAEAKPKGGGADEMYVTYDIEQKAGGDTTLSPKVKRVYIAGVVEGWKLGDFKKQSGREVHGVKIDYVPAPGAAEHLSQIAEVPKKAKNVRFHKHADLPDRYAKALQDLH